jgi:hypothetical protein
MISVQYSPYYLDSYQIVDERYLILKVSPLYYDAKFNEIHIRTKNNLSDSLFGNYGFARFIDDEVPIFICEEEVRGILSIFEGNLNLKVKYHLELIIFQ